MFIITFSILQYWPEYSQRELYAKKTCQLRFSWSLMKFLGFFWNCILNCNINVRMLWVLDGNQSLCFVNGVRCNGSGSTEKCTSFMEETYVLCSIYRCVQPFLYCENGTFGNEWHPRSENKMKENVQILILTTL